MTCTKLLTAENAESAENLLPFFVSVVVFAIFVMGWRGGVM
jgi:hypothetical protein